MGPVYVADKIQSTLPPPLPPPTHILSGLTIAHFWVNVSLNIPKFAFVYIDFMIFWNTILCWPQTHLT